MFGIVGGTVYSPLHADEYGKEIADMVKIPTVSDTLTPYADFRFRYESDWDSVNSRGMPRADRDRLRIRGRIGLKFEPTESLSFEVRARTGNSYSQTSPHLTIYDFDGGPTNEFDGILDKYYVKYSADDYWIWAGRNGLPFWKQNELFWSDDVTITGAAFSKTTDWQEGSLTGTTGAFFLPDGGWGLNGQMYAGQLVYQRMFGDLKFTAAEGLYFLDGSNGATKLRNGNGMRDYLILGSQVQLSRDLAGIPFTIGADFYSNLKEYSPTSDPFATANPNQDFGYVLSLTGGELKDPGDFQWGYYYAYLETFAVNASYAQNDYVRWGSATQTDSSDLKGHEVRMTYRATPKLDIVTRLYDVDAITSQQDGMRFRIDFNYKF